MESGMESRGALKSSPNVTPLVDVVLVLLILFIVLVPAVDESVRLPKARHASAKEGDVQPVTVILSGGETGPGAVQLETGKGQFLLLPMDTEAHRHSLVTHLRAQLAARESARIFLKADGRLSFRHVQILFDLCRQAGAEMVSAVTASETAPSPEGGLS